MVVINMNQWCNRFGDIINDYENDYAFLMINILSVSLISVVSCSVFQLFCHFYFISVYEFILFQFFHQSFSS